MGRILIDSFLRRSLFLGSLAVATTSSSSSSRSFFGTMASATAAVDGLTLFVEPTKKQTASVIMIHGLGDTAEGWIDVAESLAPKLPHVRFILPTASEKPVTLNGGMPMPSWYDIRGLDARSKETCDGLEHSTEVIRGFIDKEVAKGIPHNRIVVSGFSQGGAMSLWVGLQHEKRLAGVVSMSGYLPRPEEFKPSAAAVDTPTLFCHGTVDDVVRYEWAKLSEQHVKSKGVRNVEFKTYDRMGHSAVPAEIRDVFQFLQKVIPDV